VVAGGAWALRGVLLPQPDAAATVASAAPTTATDVGANDGNAGTMADASAQVADARAHAAPDGGSDNAAEITPALAPPQAAPEPPPAPPAPKPVVADEPVASAPAQTLRERLADAREERIAERRAAHTFAVQTDGDPALMIPAEQLIEDKLNNAGFSVVANPSRADVVVRVRAEIIGSQDLQFYGQSATVTTAYLLVRPYRNGRPLGPGIRQKLDYTPLNAEDKVEQALRSHVERVAEAMRGE
jgi:serine/threonine-protein kinase